MRKESLVYTATSIVLMAAIVAGVHYHGQQEQNAPNDEAAGESQPAIGNAPADSNVSRPNVRRTATPIRCTLPDGSVFYTNASRCEDADLDNRLSIAQPMNPARKEKQSDSQSIFDLTQKAWAQTSHANGKTLKQIPSNMKNECSFPIGKAQEMEKNPPRSTDDPDGVVWRDSYCRWVCEARVAGCEDIENYLGMTRFCPGDNYRDDKDCSN
jgi:hypothetical protein